MSELPLILFPKAKPVPPPKGQGGFSASKPQLPDFEDQKARLTPKLQRLAEAFEAERAQLSESSAGLSPEQVIVIEIAGSIDKLMSALKAAGLEWLGEYEVDDIEPDEGFSKLNKEGQPTPGKLDGRLFLTMTDQQAMEQLLAQWRKWQSGKRDFDWGFANWGKLFDQARDIRRWDERDRLDDDTLEYFRDELDYAKVTGELIPCEIEFWYRDSELVRNEVERRIQQLLFHSQNELIATCRIDEIRFHAIKCKLQVETVEQALQANAVSIQDAEYPVLFREVNIHRFRPTGQSAFKASDVDTLTDTQLRPPPSGEPVVAILDGVPLMEHEQLRDRIILDDPDDFQAEYQAHEFQHGTAMASLICHGELDDNSPALGRPVYLRPVLKPDPEARKFGTASEHIPTENFPEDLVWRAVRRIKDQDGDVPAQAPSVLFINHSLGDPRKHFYHEMSPWARLLDWLAWHYRVLFLVSAGNRFTPLSLDVTENDWKNLNDEERVAHTLKTLYADQRNRRLMPPAETINNITVGALHDDISTIAPGGRRVDILPMRFLPSPVSAQGPGFRRAVKPDLLMPGGRQLFAPPPIGTDYEISSSSLAPGQRVATVAAPSAPGDIRNTTYMRGTSNATALTTRAAARIYAMLERLLAQGMDTGIDSDNIVTVVKALLVHSACWGRAFEVLETHLSNLENKRRFKRVAAQFLGYGVTDVDHVLFCTEQRATAIGAGHIRTDTLHEYRFPLPPCLNGIKIEKRLVITLAWLTPVNPSHSGFRRAKLEVAPPDKDTGLKVSRSEADWHQVKRGTVQHEILEGKKVANFIDNDAIVLQVQCKSDAGKFDEEIPYGLAVTLEVAEEFLIGFPIYEQVQERISERVRV